MMNQEKKEKQRNKFIFIYYIYKYLTLNNYFICYMLNNKLNKLLFFINFNNNIL